MIKHRGGDFVLLQKKMSVDHGCYLVGLELKNTITQKKQQTTFRSTLNDSRTPYFLAVFFSLFVFCIYIKLSFRYLFCNCIHALYLFSNFL